MKNKMQRRREHVSNFFLGVWLSCELLMLSGRVFGVEPVRPARIKVACVGDSITRGHGIPDLERNSYPAQLQSILGQEWDVRNFGRSGAALLKRADLPYLRTPEYQSALAFEPDIVVIKLGTNDTKPRNWPHRESFKRDYVELIESFKNLNSKPKVWVCYPAPVQKDRWGIRNGPIEDLIIPWIDELVLSAGVKRIDVHQPLLNRPDLFPDHIHPNAEGAGVLAKVVADHIAAVEKEPGGANRGDSE